MPLDLAKSIYDQVWSILEADSTFASTFQVGNRQKRTSTDSQFSDNVQTMPGHFPRIAIDWPGVKWQNKVPKFFTNVGDTMPDFGIPATLTLTINIIHDTLDLGKQTVVEAAAVTPLLKAYPKFGLSYVGGGTMPEWRRREESSDRTGRTKRTISTGTLVINACPQRSAL